MSPFNRKFAACCGLGLALLGLIVGVAMANHGQHQQQRSTLSVRAWTYANNALHVQLGNVSEQAVRIDGASIGGPQIVIGREVGPCQQIVVQIQSDFEPCAVVLDTTQGRFIFALEPQLRR